LKTLLITIAFSLGCLTASAGEPATYGLGETVLAPVATYGLVQQTTCKDGFCLLPNRTRTKTVTTIAPVQMVAQCTTCVAAPVMVAAPVQACCEPAPVVMAAPVQCVAAPVQCVAAPARETVTRTRTRTRRVRNHRIFGRATVQPYTSGGYGIENHGAGLAQQKADQMASMGLKNHVGGSLGGYSAEGVGWSTRSAQDAIANTCYWGERSVGEVGVSQGRDGYYATVLYN